MFQKIYGLDRLWKPTQKIAPSSLGNSIFIGHTSNPFSIQSCRSCYAAQHLCQRSFYKIGLIIVEINKDENKSFISNQFSPKNDL
jgi:hypothetical protein